jgi:hypothetical protein
MSVAHARFLQMHLRDGELDGIRILPRGPGPCDGGRPGRKTLIPGTLARGRCRLPRVSVGYST